MITVRKSRDRVNRVFKTMPMVSGCLSILCIELEDTVDPVTGFAHGDHS